MTRVTTIISDFGGVLTTPLAEAFATFEKNHGVPLEVLGRAMHKLAEEHGEPPLFALERGEIPESLFISQLRGALEIELEKPVEIGTFGETFVEELRRNEPIIEKMYELKATGYRMGLLTNNVREWEPVWRGMLPVDEIFEVIVDSAFVGMRKPDPAIYELTLERLGVTAAESVFIDDIAVNCDAARALGMESVHFVENAQALSALEKILQQT